MEWQDNLANCCSGELRSMPLFDLLILIIGNYETRELQSIMKYVSFGLYLFCKVIDWRRQGRENSAS